MKNKVKEFRHKYGISQGALAQAVETTRRTIYAIEVENKDIHISLARKIAVHFGCGVDDLFDFEDNAHTLADKAVWFVHVVRYTAEITEKSIRETTKLLEKSGLAQAILSGYESWHTQGYEYMAEMLADELSELQATE